MRILPIILLLPSLAWSADVTLEGVGTYAGVTTIRAPLGVPAGVGSAAGVETIRAPLGSPGGVSSTAGTGYLTVGITTSTTGVGNAAGVGSITAAGIIKMISGQGATAGIGRLRTLNAVLSPLRVVKHGTGDIDVIANGINCGSDCEVDIPYGQSLTLTWSRNTTESDFFSWGNACQYAENRPTCTVTADMVGQKLFTESDGYMIASVYAGSLENPICRAGRGSASIIWYPSVQAAYNAISAGSINSPIDIITHRGDVPLIMNSSIDVELVGGWLDFMPGQMSDTSNIVGSLTVRYGSLTIGSYSGQGSVTIK